MCVKKRDYSNGILGVRSELTSMRAVAGIMA